MSEQQSFVPKVNIKVSEETKKPHLGAILFCEYATKTEKGTYLLAGCFERFLFSKDEPKVTSNFFLYVHANETRDGDFQVAVIDPNDNILIAFKHYLTVDGLLPDIPASLHFLERVRFPVAIEGTYWVDVSFKGESLGGTPLLVEFRKEGESEEGASNDEHKS